MKTSITEIKEFEEFIEKFNFFHEAQIDEDSIKSDAVELEVKFLCPLTDIPENCKIFDRFLCFKPFRALKT